MYEYRYASDDYLLIIYFEGKKYQYRIKQFHIDRSATYWHFYSKDQVQELRYDQRLKKLSQVLIPGQSPFSESFIQVLEEDFKRIHHQPD